MVENSSLCPSCGFELFFQPWIDKSAADEICPSCGIQFGYDDFAGGDIEKRRQFYRKWRKDWVNAGMPWRSSGEKPVDWNPENQLKKIEHN